MLFTSNILRMYLVIYWEYMENDDEQNGGDEKDGYENERMLGGRWPHLFKGVKLLLGE